MQGANAIKLSIVHFLETETLVPYNGGKAFRFRVVKTNIFLNLMAMQGRASVQPAILLKYILS